MKHGITAVINSRTNLTSWFNSLLYLLDILCEPRGKQRTS